MSSSRPAVAGATRTCPHCRALILDSATVCPQCQKYLKFGASDSDEAETGQTALKVEGTLRGQPRADGAEYTMLLTIRDAKGEELSRQVIGVGAIEPTDLRTFSLTVEISRNAD